MAATRSHLLAIRLYLELILGFAVTEFGIMFLLSLFVPQKPLNF